MMVSTSLCSRLAKGTASACRLLLLFVLDVIQDTLNCLMTFGIQVFHVFVKSFYARLFYWYKECTEESFLCCPHLYCSCAFCSLNEQFSSVYSMCSKLSVKIDRSAESRLFCNANCIFI